MSGATRSGVPSSIQPAGRLKELAPVTGAYAPYMSPDVMSASSTRARPRDLATLVLKRPRGFELDFQRYQHFFKDSEVFPLDPAAPPNCTGTAMPCIDLNTDAWGLMGNLVVPIRIKGAPKWRPYGTAGLGMIHAWVNERDRHQDDLGFNVGGGVMFSLSKRVGLRGDLRHFRALADEHKPDGVYFKDYGFWRATLGVTFGFPR
jgi:Outer membrane protein beta-barrel domain